MDRRSESDEPDAVETLRLPGEPSVVQDARMVKERGRYEIVAFLGAGSMGQVYKADDPMLKRSVALKFLQGDDPALVERFLQEARAQARVEHEHICKVYEVGGAVGGKPYIAMQYIEGKTLGVAAEEMSREQKLNVMKDVAEAVHAAHRTGLIHRDLKPSNIMVEKTEQGDWKPYVMDFGLAREQGAAGLTMTGVTLGTPAYMAPEQARGEVHRLDRRTDVYSLGATLYELLVGRLPFEGASSVEIMLKLVQEEAVPVRKWDPGIPVDVETIVMKCLEKEPQRRYDSARTLADDLQRYLDGEPIQARPASWTYQMEKKIRKNRAVAGVVAVAAVLVLMLAEMGLMAQWQAKERAAMAHRFGQDVKEIESIMRFAELLPLHDARREMTVIREQMKQIEAEMGRLGRVGEGPGHYALGRGHLALHEYEAAREHLEAAWQREYRAPEVGYALGQVMGALYQKALEEAQRIGSKEVREARKKEIEKAYREPALQYLKASSDAQVEAPAYVEGLIAFYEKRYEEALKKAQQAFEQVPWLYEARKLEGDIYMEVGRNKQEKGDYEGARQDYQRAGEAYQAAMETARSDTAIYQGDCGRWIQVMEVEMSQGQAPQAALERALAACDRAREADPESGDVYNKKSRIYWRQGEYQGTHGEDPRGALDKAIEMGQQAVTWNPQDTDAFNNMAIAHRIKGEYEMRHGLDPRTSLDRAIEALQRAIHINPNLAYAHNTMGNASFTRGAYEIEHGQDPRAALDRAVESYQRAIHINPNYAAAYSNMGNAYNRKGNYEMQRGIDPRASLDRAIESYQRAIHINPNYADAYNNMGIAYWRRGGYEMGRQLDPRASLDRAIESYQKAIQLNPSYAYAYRNTGIAYLTKGVYLLGQRIDPTDTLSGGRTALQKAIQIDRSDFEMYLSQSEVELVAARWAMHRGQSPGLFFKKAQALLQQVWKWNAQSADAYQTRAELHRWQAEWHLRQKQRPQEDIRQGLAMIEKALTLDSQLAEAVAIQGTLYLLQARTERDPAARVESARRAEASLEKALRMNSLLQREYQPLLTQAQ